MPGPSLAELRAQGQPQAVLDRLNDEHWAGRVYMRKFSPYATWVFARLGWSPNAVTLAYISCGLAAGVLVALGGLLTAVAAAILIQGYLLFDCSDGELARWSGRTSATGVYLDLIGHYLGEAALLIGLGLRAQGHLTNSGPYVSAGLAAAVLAVIVKAETDNVVVARAKEGLPAAYPDEALQPTGSGLALARRRQAHEAAQRRGLAGAVAAEQRRHLAFGDFEADAVQDMALAIKGMKPFGGQRGGHAAWPR